MSAQGPYPQQPPVQQYYAPPAAYAPPGAYPAPAAAPRRPSRWMAITALSIAIPAALLRFVPFVGGLFIVPVLVAIVFAVIALAVQKQGRAMSVWALAIGIVGLVMPVFFTVFRLGLFGVSLFGWIQDAS